MKGDEQRVSSDEHRVMSIKAVIFDLDGPITQPYFDFDAIREQMGLGKNSGPVLEQIEKMPPQKRQHAQNILHFHETQAVAESKLNPGAKQTIDALREQGIHIGVLTRNRRSNALAIARKHGLKFDAIVDREDGPVKPDAFGVLRICQQFNVKPQETILVGDYLFDLLCAKQAGAIAVLLANHNRAAEFAKHADFTIDSIDQLLQIIEKKNTVSNENAKAQRKIPHM
jgi:HAD superfamily hydrolase (TIGR01509 family)